MTLSGRTATLTLVALVVSVCLNVFVAGLIAGRVTTGDAPQLRQPDAGLARFMATIPEAARPVIRQAIRANRRDLQSHAAALRDARQAAAAVVSAEPFDPAALEAALAEVRQRSQALQARLHAIIAEAIDELPADLRAQMAERWGDRP